MPRPVARRLTAALLATGLLLAGCASDDEPAADKATTTTSAAAEALTTDDVAGTSDDPGIVEALSAYQPYVQQQVATIATDVKRFTDAVRAGDIERAKELYPASRQAFTRIEPLVPLIADVADVIEAEPPADGDADDPGLTGWHQLEWDLWVAEDVSDSAATADQLDAEAAKLSAAVTDFTVTPRAMVRAVALLMDWAADDAATGAGEPWSHTDMWTLAARVDAANAARQMLRGALSEADPDLAARIDDANEEAVNALKPYRSTGAWTPYDEVSEDERAELESRFRRLAERLAEMPEALGLT
jgi:iron uptake system component EfeO